MYRSSCMYRYSSLGHYRQNIQEVRQLVASNQSVSTVSLRFFVQLVKCAIDPSTLMWYVNQCKIGFKIWKLAQVTMATDYREILTLIKILHNHPDQYLYRVTMVTEVIFKRLSRVPGVVDIHKLLDLVCVTVSSIICLYWLNIVDYYIWCQNLSCPLASQGLLN